MEKFIVIYLKTAVNITDQYNVQAQKHNNWTQYSWVWDHVTAVAVSGITAVMQYYVTAT
jgi:hypothetical protein